MGYLRLSSGVAVFGLQSLANAAISQTCPSSDVCYSLSIPDTTASSGGGDIYFQITAPVTYEWVALGQGSRMAGANMFIMYTSASGQNVTVSPRLGTGHVEPQASDETHISLLEGSGVENGTMIANVRCADCQSWSGGSMDFTASSASWIHAARSGPSLNSDDVSADISMHSDYGVFDWDLAAAKGGSDVNPFLNQESQTVTPGATQSTSSSGGPSNMRDLLIAHGVMAALAWVIFFPSGAILIRLASFANAIWAHAAIQALGYLIFVAAFGIGVYMATQMDSLDHHHAIIGIVVFILASLQPLSGLLHHLGFKQHHRRNLWSAMHLTFGRAAIILGIINGGLGLQWAGNASDGQIAAYGVLAGLFGVGYLIAMIYGEVRRSSSRPMTGNSNSSASGHEKDGIRRLSNGGAS